jgi:hypothetical protein
MEPNAQPRATLTDMPLVGEPATDKAYQCLEDGRTYRVRVLPVAASNLDEQGNPITDFVMAFDITITRLNEDGFVAVNVDGAPLLVAQTRWTIQSETLSSDNPETTPSATLRRIIEQQIYTGSVVSRGQDALASLMSDWGASL